MDFHLYCCVPSACYGSTWTMKTRIKKEENLTMWMPMTHVLERNLIYRSAFAGRVMKMGNIAPRVGIKLTSLVFQASVLIITPPRLPDDTIIPYAAACLRGQCRILHLSPGISKSFNAYNLHMYRQWMTSHTYMGYLKLGTNYLVLSYNAGNCFFYW